MVLTKLDIKKIQYNLLCLKKFLIIDEINKDIIKNQLDKIPVRDFTIGDLKKKEYDESIKLHTLSITELILLTYNMNKLKNDMTTMVSSQMVAEEVEDDDSDDEERAEMIDINELDGGSRRGKPRRHDRRRPRKSNLRKPFSQEPKKSYGKRGRPAETIDDAIRRQQQSETRQIRHDYINHLKNKTEFEISRKDLEFVANGEFDDFMDEILKRNDKPKRSSSRPERALPRQSGDRVKVYKHKLRRKRRRRRVTRGKRWMGAVAGLLLVGTVIAHVDRERRRGSVAHTSPHYREGGPPMADADFAEAVVTAGSGAVLIVDENVRSQYTSGYGGSEVVGSDGYLIQTEGGEITYEERDEVPSTALVTQEQLRHAQELARKDHEDRVLAGRVGITPGLTLPEIDLEVLQPGRGPSTFALSTEAQEWYDKDDADLSAIIHELVQKGVNMPPGATLEAWQWLKMNELFELDPDTETWRPKMGTTRQNLVKWVRESLNSMNSQYAEGLRQNQRRIIDRLKFAFRSMRPFYKQDKVADAFLTKDMRDRVQDCLDIGNTLTKAWKTDDDGFWSYMPGTTDDTTYKASLADFNTQCYDVHQFLPPHMRMLHMEGSGGWGDSVFFNLRESIDYLDPNTFTREQWHDAMTQIEEVVGKYIQCPSAQAWDYQDTDHLKDMIERGFMLQHSDGRRVTGNEVDAWIMTCRATNDLKKIYDIQWDFQREMLAIGDTVETTEDFRRTMDRLVPLTGSVQLLLPETQRNVSAQVRNIITLYEEDHSWNQRATDALTSLGDNVKGVVEWASEVVVDATAGTLGRVLNTTGTGFGDFWWNAFFDPSKRAALEAYKYKWEFGTVMCACLIYWWMKKSIKTKDKRDMLRAQTQAFERVMQVARDGGANPDVAMQIAAQIVGAGTPPQPPQPSPAPIGDGSGDGSGDGEDDVVDDVGGEDDVVDVGGEDDVVDVGIGGARKRVFNGEHKNPYKYIIHPNTKKIFFINSTLGKNLLYSYIKKYSYQG